MSELLIPRRQLAALIPHAGSMCLLDGVEYWDAEGIRCISWTHLRRDNPLRADGCLSALHAVEYAAQAMAVHGGLLARAAAHAPRRGYLAGLRDVQLGTDWLHPLEGPLRVVAVRLAGAAGSFLYRFEVTAQDRLVAAGRVTVIDPGGTP